MEKTSDQLTRSPNLSSVKRRKLSKPLSQLSQELDVFLSAIRRQHKPLFPHSHPQSPKPLFTERRASLATEVTLKPSQVSSPHRFLNIPVSGTSSPPLFSPRIDSNRGHFRTMSNAELSAGKSPVIRSTRKERVGKERQEYEEIVYGAIGPAGTSRFLMRQRISP